jgi:hypothetical protein
MGVQGNDDAVPDAQDECSDTSNPIPLLLNLSECIQSRSSQPQWPKQYHGFRRRLSRVLSHARMPVEEQKSVKFRVVLNWLGLLKR